ncbi:MULTISPECIES: hypothetical protein [unclassified Arthrobacter]|uniref:hypothetical protein n=1 Tax=unclassified Arthrobacter TaxID=235627 RepID=UPI00159DD74A|nr:MULTISPECIES: hypothetical protein [unclassified Arthrobacter]MCQ9164339.1 hypothetical protein [Arthrobacter sp. STN4]NVM99518.1 hypothetical protein [Arthrobacter sp. SDTb3-6]
MDSEGSGDPAVDAIVALAGQAAALPTAEHNGVYTSVMESLQRELDTDPAADIAAAAPGGAP